MIDDFNIDLVIKYLNKQANEEEKLEFESWINKYEFNKFFYRELKRQWVKSNKDEADVIVDIEIALQSARRKFRKQKSYTPQQKIFIAIVIFFLLGLTAYSYYYYNKDYLTVENKQSKPKEIMFSDSSIAYLNTNSTIKYKKNFLSNERVVEINGEIYFEVKYNKNRPFKVSTSHSVIETDGGSFSVNDSQNNTTITSENNTIKVFVRRDFMHYTLVKADESYMYDKQNGLYIKLDLITKQNHKAWLTGKLEFTNSPLKNVCNQLSLYFKKDISLKNPLDSIKTLTADFDNQSFDEIAKTINFALDAELIAK